MDSNVFVGSICQEDPGWMIVEELQLNEYTQDTMLTRWDCGSKII